MRALKNAILPKHYVTENYSHIESDWPAFGIPVTLVCDNGLEFHSKQLQRVCETLHIELMFCPKGEPNYKGMVERFLGTLNRSVCHALPGTTFSNIDARGEYDPSKFACVTLSELNEIVHMWLIDVYAQQLHRITHHTPYALWLRGLKSVSPILPASLHELSLLLCKEETRTLSNKGIQFNHLYFNSNELAQLRTDSRTPKSVKFRYDVEDLSHIWVRDEVSQSYLKVPCIYEEYTKGLTLRQHLFIIEQKKEEGLKGFNEDRLLRGKARFYKQLKTLMKSPLQKQRQKAVRDSQNLNLETRPTRSRPQLPLTDETATSDTFQEDSL